MTESLSALRSAIYSERREREGGVVSGSGVEGKVGVGPSFSPLLACGKTMLFLVNGPRHTEQRGREATAGRYWKIKYGVRQGDF